MKADTIDVNVAGSLRFTSEDWQAAGEVFSRELAGVQLLDERQVSEEVGCWVIEGVRQRECIQLYSKPVERASQSTQAVLTLCEFSQATGVCMWVGA